jgi:hypothetical protein
VAAESNRSYEEGDEMTSDVAAILLAIPVVMAMFIGLGIAWLAIHGRQRIRELAYQERIALIEKGLIPSPETDPGGFEAMLGAPRSVSVKALRYRTAGIVLTGFGVALTVLLFFVVPAIRGIAIGVGGSLAVLGLTVLANGLLLASDGGESIRRHTTAGG